MAVAARKFVVNKCHPATFQWPGCQAGKKKPPSLRSFYWRTKVSLSVFSKCCVSTRFLLSKLLCGPPPSAVGVHQFLISQRPEKCEKLNRQLPRFLCFPILARGGLLQQRIFMLLALQNKTFHRNVQQVIYRPFASHLRLFI